MTFQDLVFYLFSAVLLFAAARVITTRHPVQAALHLVLAFFTAAALWMELEAEFLAIALVLVYVGAVMVLFLFVVMMLDINLDRLREGFWRHAWLAVGVAVAMAVEMALVLTPQHLGGLTSPAPHAAGYSNTRELGNLIYTHYVYAFELAAVVLLVAIVAAIALTLRGRKRTRYQNPGAQVAVRRNDRVRVLKMDAEQPLAAEPSDSGAAG